MYRIEKGKYLKKETQKLLLRHLQYYYGVTGTLQLVAVLLEWSVLYERKKGKGKFSDR